MLENTASTKKSSLHNSYKCKLIQACGFGPSASMNSIVINDVNFLRWCSTTVRFFKKNNLQQFLMYTVSCTPRKKRICQNHAKYTLCLHVKQACLVTIRFFRTLGK